MKLKTLLTQIFKEEVEKRSNNRPNFDFEIYGNSAEEIVDGVADVNNYYKFNKEFPNSKIILKNDTGIKENDKFFIYADITSRGSAVDGIWCKRINACFKSMGYDDLKIVKTT